MVCCNFLVDMILLILAGRRFFILGKGQNKLKEQEYRDLVKIWNDLSFKVKGFSSDITPCTVFCVFYLAYLAIDNQIEDTMSLVMFVEKKLDIKRRSFISRNICDLWWLAVKLKADYSKEQIAALMLRGVPEWNLGMCETPESIVRLAGMLLEGTGGTVADFCCGAGSFLLEAVNREEGSSYFGIETNAGLKEMAAIRMELVSCGNAEIDLGSVFSVDCGRKFDRIFCDYPWGVRTDNLQNGNETSALADIIPELLKTATADWMFIVNAAYHLSDGGRAVVVTSNNMTQKGGVNAAIRRKLVSLGWLEAVISLPEKMLDVTPAAVSLLVLSRNNREVRMVDASLMASKEKKKNVISDEAAAEIVSLLGRDSSNSVRVSPEMLAGHNYVLNLSEYLDTVAGDSRAAAFNAVVKSIKRGTQIKASELHGIESDRPTDFRYLVLANIQDGVIGGEFIYLSKIDKKLDKYCVNDNNLIISRSGTPVRTAVASVKDGQKIVANGNLFVVELDRSRVNPYFIKAYLESAEGASALSKIMTGTTLPNIPVDSLLRMRIPLPPLEEQDAIADKCREKIDIIMSLKERLAQEMKELKNIYK